MLRKDVFSLFICSSNLQLAIKYNGICFDSTHVSNFDQLEVVGRSSKTQQVGKIKSETIKNYWTLPFNTFVHTFPRYFFVSFPKKVPIFF